VIEDIPEWDFVRLSSEFGKRVAELVWWVTKPKPDKFRDKEDRNRFYHQQLHERAPREALIIKLADRLHNLATMWEVTPEKRERKIQETENFYFPLAVREIILIHEIEAALDVLKSGKPNELGGAT
jgi:(p)ppGpp synthase/HD superfamily hydrolase